MCLLLLQLLLLEEIVNYLNPFTTRSLLGPTPIVLGILKNNNNNNLLITNITAEAELRGFTNIKMWQTT